MTNGFITKIDCSDNRQIKQRVLTDTILSGSTTLGTSFSDLPNGPNPNISGITETLSGNVYGTFSSNTISTTFIFNDTRLDIGVINLSAITESNSGITQSTGNVFTSSSSTIIDDNTVNLSYSGVSYTFNVTGMTSIGGGNYTGETNSSDIIILSADTLDYTGRTVWCDVKGIINADKIETDTIVLYGDLSACTGTIYATSFSGCSPMNLYGVIVLDNGEATVLGDLTVLGDFKVSGGTNTEMHTQTILAEDNNIELNFGGNHQTAIGGGITVISGQSNNDNSNLSTNNNGWWVSTPGMLNNKYTPINGSDSNGDVGYITYDDNYIYVKTDSGWRRTLLEVF